MKRFNRDKPCPICGGWDSQKRGEGKRCHGFRSKDRKYAHCARSEFAGSIRLNEKSGTYAHIMRGDCDCGQHHEPVTERDTMKIVNRYSYQDANGNLVLQVVRGEPKAFWLRQPDGAGWKWNSNGVAPVLYHLPQLIAANPKRSIYLPEGEKDADNLAKLGVLTTTNPGGAGKWKPEFSDILRGRKVVIIPDNDEPGQAHAKQVAQSLIGIAKRVKILSLPNLPPHGDVSDWIRNGGTARELKRLASITPEVSDVEVADRGIHFRSGDQMSAAAEDVVKWIVPGIIAAGATTDLIGRVKFAGKTTLLAHISSAVIRGEEFMGLKTTKTPVVYLSEQPRVSFHEAMKRAKLAGEPDFVYLLWAESMSVPWPKLITAALSECKKRGAELLIIDTIAPFAGLSGATENDSGHALSAMKPLQAVTASNIGVVIVQHERKGGGDVGEAGRGSTAFAGAVDILVSLRGQKGKNSRTCASFIRSRASVKHPR